MDAEQAATPQSASGAEASDTDLWNALKQGQVNALGILYDRHVGLVYAIALKTMKNTQDAEDLTQEIFLHLIKTGYDPKRGSLRTFLAILTRSRSIDWLRRQHTQALRHQHLEQYQHLEQHQQTHHLSVESLYREECAQEVRDALAQLSENQQRVLHLAYHDGLSQTAIAEQLGSPLGTVKAWARRGLLKLRQNLQGVLENE